MQPTLCHPNVVTAAHLEACKCYHITFMLVAHTMSIISTAATTQVRAAQSESDQTEKSVSVSQSSLRHKSRDQGFKV